MAEKNSQFSQPRALIIGVSLAGLAAASGVWALGRSQSQTILPGTRVGSVVVGGLSMDQATQVLTEAAKRIELLTLSIDGTNYPITLADWGIRVDGPTTAERAIGLGTSTNRFASGFNQIRSFFRALTIPANLNVIEDQLTKQAVIIAGLASLDERDAAILFKDGNWQVTASANGKIIDSQSIRLAVLRAVAQLATGPITLATLPVAPAVTTQQATALLPQAETKTRESITLQAPNETITLEAGQLAAWVEVVATSGASAITPVSLRLNQSQIEAYVRTLATRFNADPIDARVVFKSGKVQVTQDSQAGRKLNESQLVDALVTAWSNQVKRTVELPFAVVNPEVSSDTLANLGLKELIGTATTSYVGSPDNRKHNIANGVKFLTSKLVKPGLEFSTVSALGAVDNTTGYLPELVIKENRTTPEFGGGLCQVSTTLFRAALAAGLRITERQNHSYRVSYYERGVGPGLDATIYLPSPDMKFANDTPGWILIQGYVTPEKNEITFELYGTSDGRRSEVSKPDVSDITSPDAPIYVDTADLPTGEVKQIEHAHDGAKTTVTYKVFKVDGSAKFDQVFRSSYKAWPARYLVGTGPVPATEETPPTTP